MSPRAPAVLLLTPFHRHQRGNTLTSLRLQQALGQQGFRMDLLSLEDEAWRDILGENLAGSKYELLHGFNARYMGELLAEFPGMKDLPFILTTTGCDLNYDLNNQGRGQVLTAFAAARKIIVFHDYFRGLVRGACPDCSAKLVTITQGIWLEESPPIRREDLGLEADSFVVLLPSGIRPVKDIALALDGLQMLYNDFEKLRLLIIGPVIDGDYGQKILKWADELNWVIYLGEVPHNEMRGYLSLADVILNTSQAEGQPQALLEGMSLNKPAILTAVPGNLGIIEDGQQGYYIRNREELASAARKMLVSADKRQKMGAEAGKLVKENFSLEREAQSYAKVYRQALKNGGR